MDTELLKTFVEVNRTRHFGKAAEHLFLTQSAVSARIRQLEQTLGVQLFTRMRNNVGLTPQGERLLRHAESMLNAWTRARQEIAASVGASSTLAVGGVPGLWDSYLEAWLLALDRQFPEHAISAEAHTAEVLQRRVRECTLDLGFAFELPQLAGLTVRALAGIRLILVTTHAGVGTAQALENGDYVVVDWGTGFALRHARAFADCPAPRLRFDLGRLARTFLLARGGSAYLPEAMVAADLAERRLSRVEGAPTMQCDACAYFNPDASQAERIDSLLDPLQAAQG